MPELMFLLDADMPRSSAEVLRALDIDVKDVRDLGMRYAKDSEIIAYAQRTGRVVITRDWILVLFFGIRITQEQLSSDCLSSTPPKSLTKSLRIS